MKKHLLLTLITLIAIPVMSDAQERWFVSGTLNANVISSGGNSSHTVGLGVGIHRMLGDKFSAGINFSYAKSGDIEILESDLSFAYYGKIADRFYYVPEVAVGVAAVTENSAAFVAGISPFGLEFRPVHRLGLRINIINFTYMRLSGADVFSFMVDSGLSVNYFF